MHKSGVGKLAPFIYNLKFSYHLFIISNFLNGESGEVPKESTISFLGP